MKPRSPLEQLLSDLMEQLVATQSALGEAQARIRELEAKEGDQ